MTVAPDEDRGLAPDEKDELLERAARLRPLLDEFPADERWKVLLAIVAPEVFVTLDE